MLESARAKVPHADLRLGRLEALPLETASVGGAVCALAMEHVADLDPVYGELRRVLHQGGWLVVSVLHPVMALIPGWTAWFVEDSGRSDVATHPHQVSDHINIALQHHFQLRYCREVPLDLGNFESLGPAAAEFGTRIAVDGLPLVLLLLFEAAPPGRKTEGR
jgi:SAM-dependent methyltransferase